MDHDRKLSILQICSSNANSGAENHVLSLSKGLSARGHRLLVATPPNGWFSDRLMADRIPTWNLKMKDLDYWISIFRFAVHVKRRRVDLIHTHLSRAACIGHAVSRITRVPQVVTAHVHNTARIYRRISRRGNRVIAVSRHVTELLLHNGVRADLIVTVPHGTNFGELSEAADPLSVYHEFGIPSDRPIVGLVGKVCRDKGQWELVQALEMLLRRDVPVQLLLVGRSDESFAQKLNREIDLLGLRQHVVFTGVRNDVARLLDSFTICAVPSRMETFGLAAIEASARGKPVVATRIGALPEVVRDGVTGLLVESGAGPLASAIADLLSDPPKATSLGENGRRLVKAEFSVDRMVDRTEAVYYDCLNSARGSGPA